MKTAFITGVTGQDGSYLAELLLNKGYKVFGLVRMSSIDNLSRISNILSNTNFKVLYGDMTDEASLYKAIQTSNPDEIYNLAAQSHVGLSANFSEYTTNVNALGPKGLHTFGTSVAVVDIVSVFPHINSEQRVHTIS